MPNDYNDDKQAPAIATAEETFATLRAGRTSHPLARVTEPGADTGFVRATVAGAVLSPDEVEALAAERGAVAAPADIRNDLAALDKRIAYLDAQLAPTGFDLRTGAQTYRRSEDERARLATERAGLIEERETQNRALSLANARRANEIQRQGLLAENDVAVQEWVNGDPNRREALDNALIQREAGVLADWILARRYGLHR